MKTGFVTTRLILSAMFSVRLAWQIGMIAQSEARQRGMQVTKSLTPLL